MADGRVSTGRTRPRDPPPCLAHPHRVDDDGLITRVNASCGIHGMKRLAGGGSRTSALNGCNQWVCLRYPDFHVDHCNLPA